MSEQTPEQSTGEAIDAEPSMEDILASIRKIIADDGDPVPLDSPAAVETTLAPIAVDADPVETLDPDDLDIDALLNDVDLSEPESLLTQNMESEDLSGSLSEDLLSQDLLSEFAEDDPLNLEIPIVPDDVDGGSLQDAAVENVRADGDFEALMDDILVGDDALQPEIEAKLDAGEASEMAARDLPDIETSEDMDLVRSLMDDLTDEDVVEGAAGSVDPVADDDFGMAEAEAGADSAIEADLDTLSSDDTDILDTILDMTLDDAIAEIPMDVPEVQAEIDDLPEPVPEPEIETPISADAAAEIEAVDLEDITDSAPSLADIAASAEADAQALSLETGATAAAIAASVGTGAASLTQSSDADVDMSALMDEAEAAASEAAAADAMESDTGPVEPAVQETIETPNVSEDTSEDTSEMETPMPRAVRSDAILDEVTETATATAFAELNQVVEEKAVYNERGPRIGDLVQEALKPMLKDWLDANLKGIVERAVAKEVKRISSGK